MAAKARVAIQIAPDCTQRAKELEHLIEFRWHHRFDGWYQRCYFFVLDKNVHILGQKGHHTVICERARAVEPTSVSAESC
eukprot:11787145-Karenia_brevis.AAC.1